MTKLVTCDSQITSFTSALATASAAQIAALAAAMTAAGACCAGTGGSTTGNTGPYDPLVGAPAKVLPSQWTTKNTFSQVTTSGFVTSPATGATPTAVTYSLFEGTSSYSEPVAADSFGTWNASKSVFTFSKACIVDISCGVDMVVAVDAAGTSGNAGDQNHVSMAAYLTVGAVAVNAGFFNVDTTTTGYVGQAAVASYPNLKVAAGDTVFLTVRSSGASGSAAVRFFVGPPGPLTQSGGDEFQGILIARRG